MKVIQRVFELSQVEYYQTHLKIINTVLPLNITDKEIEVLSHFMVLPPEILKYDNFNSLARSRVKESLNLSDAGLSNHIKSLRNKKFVRAEGKNLFIEKALIPDNSKQGYNLILKIKDTTANNGGI